jgi:alkylglycerol monooxygenase
MEINVYAVTTPLILGIIVVELAFCLWERNGYYQFEDSLANLGTAMINQVVNVPVHWLAALSYGAIRARFGLWAWDEGWASWLVLMLGIDFLFYWFHRAGHRIPFFWAAHAPHHSSEELNYTVGIRASATQRAASFLFFWPLAVLGFPPERILPVVALHLLWQLWPHTRAVKRLPAWFESVFNAPTHHRVHHAINDRYIDKNYGGALIVWDKLFGTYEPETEECVYGVKPAVASYCPIKINLQFWAETWKESVAAGSVGGFLAAWLIPPDWRRPPRPRTAKPEPFPAASGPTRRVLVLQAAALMPVMLLVTRDDSPLGPLQKALAGALIGAAAFSWGRRLEG